jgi:ferritin-like protein
MASEGLHEREDVLDPAIVDRHRAITSLGEELEAIDWYDQRVGATESAELAAVLAHNRDEEKEHAAMALEWLRRNDPVLDQHLRTYLFTDASIVGEEHAAEHGGDSPSLDAVDVHRDTESAGPTPDGSLAIGSLKEERT